MNPTLNLFERGFTICVLLYFTSTLFCQSLFLSPDALANAAEESNPFDPIFSKVQLVIYGITILLLLARWRTTLMTLARHKLLLLFLLLVVGSSLWSDLPGESWRKGLNTIATSCFGVYTASRYSLKEQLQHLTIALGLATVFSLLFSLGVPGSAIEVGANAGSWRGPLTQKNLLARLMVLTMTCNLLAIWQFQRGQVFYWSMLALSTAMLLLTGSKTGLLVLLVLLALIPLYRALRLKDTVMIPILIAVILVVGTVSTMLLGNWEAILVGLGRDPSLSGRTELWESAIGKIMEKPWLGYGYRAFWQSQGEATEIWKALGYEPPHAHNGYLNTSLDLGLVGLGLFGVSLIVSYARSLQYLRLSRGVIGLFPILYVTFMFMYNHTESTIVEHNSIFWAEFVAMSLALL
jgi:exopolysaccharide production protein ExoQ